MKEDKKRIQEKVGNYAKYVKEMYWPKVSDAKRQELQLLKESIKPTPAKTVNSARRKLVPSLNDDRYEDYMTESY